MKTNAQRFIEAYNTIDYALRTVCKQKRSLSFSDAVRRSVQANAVIRKYEDDLIDFARLRNSIVHSYNPNITIAEPHDDVVAEIEKIAELISIPPKALSYARREVIGVEHTENIIEVLKLASEYGFSNMPVFQDEALVGVANLGLIARALGTVALNGEDINTFLKTRTIAEILPPRDQINYFVIVPENLTVEEALNLFYENRKLVAIIITKKGNFHEKPLGILTTGDVIDLNNVLENY